MSLAHKGFKHTEESKRNLSKKLKGKKRTQETKDKISLAKRGSKNPAWNNGSSFEPYGLKFNNELKKKIRERDNYICQECSVHQNELKYKMPIHHIDYNKQNNNENNLISLCKSCHSKTNFNRKDWIEYFKKKIN